MKKIDTLIHARWLIPVNAQNELLENHSIAIHDGRIIEILPRSDTPQKYQADIENNCDEHIVIPGLINAHTHAAMTLFRGLADDKPLMEWLTQHIWPAEQKWVNEEFVHDGSELAMAEMLRSGTTCFNDMYFFPDVTARLARDVGMRTCVGLIALDFPTVWADNAAEYIEKGLALRDKFRSDSLIHTPFAPHAPYTVSDESLKQIRMFADEMDLPVHIHLHETEQEITDAVKNSGKRPIERLNDLGLISPNLVAVHMAHLTDDEIELLSKSGSHIVHCPESNMKLASGSCEVQKCIDAGINVALGTDSASSNNDLDMFSEMRCAALLGKLIAKDASALKADQVLRMATINGAKALGLDEQTGSLEVGKFADITAVHVNTLETTPLYQPLSHLIYSCGREQVSDVWVAGRHLLKDRALTTLDEQKIIHKCRLWNDKISQN